MREANAPRNIGPPLVLRAEDRVERAELILVHRRIVGLHISRAWRRLLAVGSQVSVPHKLKFRIGRNRITDERTEARCPVYSQLIYGYRARNRIQRKIPIGFISDEGRHLPSIPPVLCLSRQARYQKGQPSQQPLHPDSHSFSPVLPSSQIYNREFMPTHKS